MFYILYLMAQVILAPFRALFDAFIHLRDGVLRILAFFGIVQDSGIDDFKPVQDRDRESRREYQQAVSELDGGEHRRNRRELATSFAMNFSVGKRAKEWKKQAEAESQEYSKGQVVNHLFAVNQKAKADNSTQKETVDQRKSK